MLDFQAVKHHTTAEEAAYARSRVAERDSEAARRTVALGVLFNAALLIATPFFSADFYTFYVRVAAAVCLAVDVSWLLFFRRSQVVTAARILFIFNMPLVGSLAYALRLAAAHGDLKLMVFSASALISLTTILIILSPFSDRRTPLMAGCFWVLTAVCLMRPESTLNQWMIIYGFTVAFSAIVRQGAAATLRRQTILEYRLRQADMRALGAKMQRDLELAREIQDSMAPVSCMETPEGLRVHCLQVKYEKVAGDWMAVRRWPDGTLVVMVADATGKGLQAALVVHAIQSLWATAMDETSFDPAVWLERLNRALYRLGEKHPHTATVGIATIQGKRLSYWSAGHLPLFLLLGSDEHLTYRSLVSRGSVLGLSQAVKVVPQYIDILPTFPVRALLCSDGLVERASLIGLSEITGLYQGFKASGLEFLGRVGGEDDKTLIVIEKNIAAWQGVPPVAV